MFKDTKGVTRRPKTRTDRQYNDYMTKGQAILYTTLHTENERSSKKNPSKNGCEHFHVHLYPLRL